MERSYHDGFVDNPIFRHNGMLMRETPLAFMIRQGSARWQHVVGKAETSLAADQQRHSPDAGTHLCGKATGRGQRFPMRASQRYA
jgi:hypothetical protein